MKPPIEASEAKESTRSWWSSPGVVYFITAGSPPLAVKIGMAAQTGKNTLISTLKRRLSAIQSSNHELVRLVGLKYFSEGDYPTRDAEIFERELHLEFHELQRFKPHSRGAEWFDATTELMEKISQISVPPSEFGVPELYGEKV
tara:strand:+ start:76 stop:507 length:432 start_codon:yes stop_codon:yes gene_type:complete